MSVNRHKPHLLVLPEDDANRQLARGFELELSTRQFQVLQPAGGWLTTLKSFVSDQAPDMRAFPERHMVLLIDFDGDPERLGQAKADIPADLQKRVYILGSLKEPEDLRPELGTFERIGESLARDCRNDTRRHGATAFSPTTTPNLTVSACTSALFYFLKPKQPVSKATNM